MKKSSNNCEEESTWSPISNSAVQVCIGTNNFGNFFEFGALPMKNYFEKTMNGEKEENFESINSKFYSHRESEFKNPKISGSRRIEVKN
jgi:hypothetical protein